MSPEIVEAPALGDFVEFLTDFILAVGLAGLGPEFLKEGLGRRGAVLGCARCAV